MHHLLPHYERELAELRALAQDFAERYPQVAGRMAVSSEMLDDPQIERLMQAFALLSARVQHRLDDDYSLFSRAYLELIYPHYLRALPACAIASFVVKDADTLARAEVLPRGLELQALLAEEQTCSFRTTADLQRLPLRITTVIFRPTAAPPGETRIPSQTQSILSLKLELSANVLWSELGVDMLRVYVDGEQALITLLHEALCSQVLATMVKHTDSLGWVVDDMTIPRSVGFDDAQALFDLSAGNHSAYRLLTEYAAFPQKFNFVDIPLPAAAKRPVGTPMTLHFALGGRRGADAVAVLETVCPDNLRLGCAPVINLFARRTSAQSINAETQCLAVDVETDDGEAGDVYAIQQVLRVQQGPAGTTTTVVPPSLSLRHDLGPDRDGVPMPYWMERRNADEQTPGCTEILFVDLDTAPVDFGADTFCVDVLATDRNLSSRIRIGKPDGDCVTHSTDAWERIVFLTPPTPAYRFDIGKGDLWRLIAQLSLHHLLLTDKGIDALRGILGLYDLPGNAVNRRIRDALVAISVEPVPAYIRLDGFTSFVRGAEITLVINDHELADVGLHLLTDVLGRLFALCAHRNSFTRLRLVSARTSQVLVKGANQIGEKELL